MSTPPAGKTKDPRKSAADPKGKKLAAEYAYLGYLDRLRKLQSVVEFGCGLGNWLRVARELGATRILGYDSPYIPLTARGLAIAEFSVVDFTKTIRVRKAFDLAICLELVQRLAPKAGMALVRTLCSSADWVLFSAALPYQGGGDHGHENWMEYWAGTFRREGFLCYDILRAKFWYDQRIPFYLRQNCCLYVRRGTDAALAAQGLEHTDLPPSLVHPELYLRFRSWLSNRQKPADSRTVAAEAAAFYRDAQMTASADRSSAPVAGEPK